MPALTGSNTIVLQGDGPYEEGPLTAVASPGMNVVLTTTAEVFMRNTYTPGLVDGTGLVQVLREDSIQGKTVNDAYAIGDTALVYCAEPGDVILVLVASGQTIAKADGLSAGATGKFQKVATEAPCARSLEDSGGALAADTLLRARVI
jgi:hypothetical protein